MYVCEIERNRDGMAGGCRHSENTALRNCCASLNTTNPPHTHKHPSSPPSSSPFSSPSLHQRRAVSIYISHQPPETCHHHTAWLSDPQLLSAMFLLHVSANTHSHTHLEGTGTGGWGGTRYSNCKAKLLPIRFCSQLNC